MRKIKIILISMLLSFIVVCCGPARKTTKWYNIGAKGELVQLYDATVSKEQLDSIIIADTLQSDLNTWIKVMNGPDNKGRMFYRYLYVKDRPSQDTYILRQYDDSTYNITKRIIKFN